MLWRMTADHAANLSRIGLLLRQAQRHSTRTFAAALQPLGIEGRHFGVLFQLDLHGPLSQRRLMDLTGEDRSAMVRTVDDLERMGLAIRRPDPVDRRAHAVELTAAGNLLRAQAGAVAEEVAAHLLDGFTPEERDALFVLLERFAASPSRPTNLTQEGPPR
jgi:MarR family transcriptional regulator, lower aerobic nicotinate degradation pathway regulator